MPKKRQIPMTTDDLIRCHGFHPKTETFMKAGCATCLRREVITSPKQVLTSLPNWFNKEGSKCELYVAKK